MQDTSLSTLKEIRSHGTKNFPCTIYQTRATSNTGIHVKHHWHDEIEIVYFSGGHFTIEINMQEYNIDSECFYFINPGELHSIIGKTTDKYGEDAIVLDPSMLSFEAYDATQINLIQPLLNGTMLFPRCITPTHPSFSPIYQAFTEIIHSFGRQLYEESPTEDGAITDDLTNQLFIKSSLLRILAVLSRYHLFIPTQKNYNKKVEGIKTALTYIKENYKEKIYISDLAKLLNMNEQYFCRYFKKAIGYSPIEYVNEYRIKQAIQLLKETDLSVMDICLECGYNNLGNFLREFRKHTDTTPLQYKKKSK